jgi:serine/threonine protein kinase
MGETPVIRIVRPVIMSTAFGRPELSRYPTVAVLGQGAYGKVYKARDTQTGQFIAMKKTLHNFEREGVPTTVLREICLLRELNHENIVSLKDIVVTERRLYLIFEFVESDLRKFIHNHEGPINPMEIKRIMYQMLKGICFCHSRRIMHRDLKPENILVSENATVKIADFGLARAFQIPMRPYTNEVQTLWYRAPELLLGATEYSVAIDMWSAGCILADLIRKTPLFRSNTEMGQLTEIMKVMGTPSEAVWPGVSQYRNFSSTFPTHHRVDFHALFPEADPLCIDLLEKLLVLDPSNRISAKAALTHRYFEEMQVS